MPSAKNRSVSAFWLADQVSKIEKLVTDLVEQHNLEEKIEQTRSFIAFCQYNPDKNKPAKETWILARVNGFEKWVTTLPVYARLNENNKERIAEAFKRCRVFIQRHPRLEGRMLISSDRDSAEKGVQRLFKSEGARSRAGS